MDMKKKSLGEYIKKWRKELKLSQLQLAKNAGLARSYLSRLEDNQFESPSAMMLIKLAHALKISHETLFQVAGYVPHIQKTELPSFDVYMRTKYPDLPVEAIKEIEQFKAFVEHQYRNEHAHPRHKNK